MADPAKENFIKKSFQIEIAGKKKKVAVKIANHK